MKKIIRIIKTFLYGFISGVITTIISYLYLKNQHIIKKLIRINKNEKNNNKITQDRKHEPIQEEMSERRRIRQRNNSNERQRNAVEGCLQCGQLERTEIQDRNRKQRVLGNSGDAQSKIQSNIDNKQYSNKGMDKTNRKRKNITNNSGKSKMEKEDS